MGQTPKEVGPVLYMADAASSSDNTSCGANVSQGSTSARVDSRCDDDGDSDVEFFGVGGPSYVVFHPEIGWIKSVFITFQRIW
jgi:hypothetical protein